MNWNLLEGAIKSCKKCDGLNSVELGTQNAPGYGNKQSKVVFLGQSLCGKPCIDAQIPFTGGSGRLLDQAFELAGIQKHDIYITNVVKCHPPGNRPSLDHEIKNCAPYLEDEIKWISPKTIVCLGKDAWRYADKFVTKQCIKEVALIGVIVTVHFLYHPSYIMKRPKVEREKYIAYISEIVKSTDA